MRRRVGPGLVFFAAMLVGAASVVGYFAYERHAEAFAIHSLTPDVWVTDQLSVDRVNGPQIRRFRTVIDLRPDGEAPDQAPAAKIEQAVRGRGLDFAFVPVPHGDIPPPVVASLSEALNKSPKPVLLYCRTGRRAARTWALSEAKRPGGLSAAEIENAVRDVGQTADDLDAAIADDVSHRAATTR